jgi:hypothetical protein
LGFLFTQFLAAVKILERKTTKKKLCVLINEKGSEKKLLCIIFFSCEFIVKRVSKWWERKKRFESKMAFIMCAKGAFRYYVRANFERFTCQCVSLYVSFLTISRLWDLLVNPGAFFVYTKSSNVFSPSFANVKIAVTLTWTFFPLFDIIKITPSCTLMYSLHFFFSFYLETTK